MASFLLRFLIVLTICYPSFLFSSGSLDPDEKDLELSKKSFLISGASYEDLKSKNKGVMTLFFKDVEGQTFEHASLVFEMLLSKNPNEVYMTMIHYAQEDDCCGFGGKEKILINDHDNTLCKTYGGIKTTKSSGKKERIPASYRKYASWIVPNDKLLKGLTVAEDDDRQKYSPGNCVKYIKRIMENVGLTKVDFGLWLTTPRNLKILVDDYIMPKYDIKHKN